MKIKNIIFVIFVFIGGKLFAGFQDTGDFVPFQKKLCLRALDNQTQYSSFKAYYANNENFTLLLPKSTFVLKAEELFLQPHEVLCLQCVKGSFLPIYIKDEGKASGQAPLGFYGPFYLSMWLNYPDVPEDQKTYVRYVVKIGHQAEFAIRINVQGDCQILALQNMELLV